MLAKIVKILATYTGNASLTEELVGVQNGDDRFLALVGCHREFHLALVEVPQAIWDSHL